MLTHYFHTLRHLRATQVLARLLSWLPRARPQVRAAPARRAVPDSYVTPVEAEPTLVAPEVFRFLNTERACRVAADWQPTDADKLWIYHLHYFDDLNARAAAARSEWQESLLQRWVAEVPPGQGDAWEPYPVSRRIVNWVKWSLRGRELSAACRQSLALQARWLYGALEYHLLGNHLFVNAKALVHAGLYFGGAEAERWYARGMHVLSRELSEQVLSDGGHFERSTMYHALALEDLLDLVNLLRAYAVAPPSEWLAAIPGMRRWLQVMTHPDGEIAFFNDAAFGMAPTAAQLDDFAARLGFAPPAQSLPELVVLEPSGYVRVLRGSAYLVCDCAPLGPDYQLGHAHADTLSFELSIAGRRLFVNSGTSRYGVDSERRRQRGTAAHNTVVVDGTDSSEVWSGFRVARRARAALLVAAQNPQGMLIEGGHDGYGRLPGRNEHRRRWQLGDSSLTLEDRISGTFQIAEARFHLHPNVSARLSGAREVLLTGPEHLRARLSCPNATSVELVDSHWHPYFGVGLANQCIIARFAGDDLHTRIDWGRSA
jgi:uncharacterized heparinase superfamily protein